MSAPQDGQPAVAADADSSNQAPSGFSFATVRVPTICLLVFYAFDFTCLFFLPADHGRFEFDMRRGTADLWVLWLSRLALCAVVCCIGVYKAIARLLEQKAQEETAAAEEKQKRLQAAKSGAAASQKNLQEGGNDTERTPLLASPRSDGGDKPDRGEHAEEEEEELSPSEKFRRVAAAVKDADELMEQWNKRKSRAFLFNAAFGVAFVAHVASNVFISIKALEYRYDEKHNAALPDNSTTSNSSGNWTSTTTAASHVGYLADYLLVRSGASAEMTTMATTTTTATAVDLQNVSLHAVVPRDASLWEGPTPPPAWIAVLVSLLILWSTAELFALHFFFKYVKKALEEFDIPAFVYLHPHPLAFEGETVMSKCTVCNKRFRPQDRKFICARCDTPICGNCCDIKLKQWVDKLAVEEAAAKQKQQQQQQQQAALKAEGEAAVEGAAVAASAVSATTTTAATPSSPTAKPGAAGDALPSNVIIGGGDRIVIHQITKMQIMKELWTVTKGFRYLIVIGTIALVAGTGINIAVPRLQGDVINAIILRDWHSCVKTLILYSLLSLGQVLLSSSRTFSVMLSSRLAINALRSRLFGSILARDFSFLDSTTSGNLQSRLTRDTNSMITPLQIVVNQVLNNVILLFGATFMSLTISWQLSLFAFSIVGPVVYLSSQYADVAYVINRRTGDSLADSNNIANEAFTNMRTLQSFGTERYERRRYSRAMDQTVALARTTAWYNAGLIISYNIFDLVVWTLTLGCGGYLVINHPSELSAGLLVSFQLYVAQLTGAYRSIANSLNSLTSSAGAAERVMNIMRRDPTDASVRPDADDEDDDPLVKRKRKGGKKQGKTSNTTTTNNNNSAVAVPTSPQQSTQSALIQQVPPHESSCWIRFRDVRFTYPTRPAQQILKGLTMDLVRPGEITALVAASGSGKSTCLQLLLKFYKLQGGVIEVGFKRAGTPESASKREMRRKAPASQPPSPTAAAAATAGAATATTTFASASAAAENRQPSEPQQDLGGMPAERSHSFASADGGAAAAAAASGMMGRQSSTVHYLPEDDPFRNEANFDFYDLSRLDRRSWLKDIAVVSQQTQLWNSTVLENIAYGSFMSDEDDEEDEGEEAKAGDKSASSNKSKEQQQKTEEEESAAIAAAAAALGVTRTKKMTWRDIEKIRRVQEAAKAAQAHDFIMELPDGYDSVTGERGATISGGQAQRLSIARALLRKPSLLLLDEATSALDNESEAKVQAAIEALLDENRRTRAMSIIIIAHRLSSIKNADRILVLDKGQLVQEGSHEELMSDAQKDGLYARYVAQGAVGSSNSVDKNEAADGGGGGGGDKKSKKGDKPRRNKEEE